jgi:hypothetical protein
MLSAFMLDKALYELGYELKPSGDPPPGDSEDSGKRS